MKILILVLLASAIFAGCTKNKCEGCTVHIQTYVDDQLQSDLTRPMDCGATPGTTVKRAPMAFGKTLTTIQTTKCY